MGDAILRLTNKYPAIVSEDFEQSIGGWTTGGTNTIGLADDSTLLAGAVYGSQFMLVEYVDNVLIATLDVTLESAVPHTFSAWIWASSGFSAATPRIRTGGFTDVKPYNTNSIGIYDANTAPTRAIAEFSKWHRVILGFIPDPDDLTGNIRINCGSAPSAGSQMRIDGVKVEALPMATPFQPEGETDTVDLIFGRKNYGLALNSVRPQVSQYKGGGTYLESPFAEGRTLVDAKWSNVIETFDLKAKGLTQDHLTTKMQDIRRIVTKAVQYWATDWATTPVWIEAKSSNETNTRYSIIHNGTIAEDNNPWGMPFLQQDKSAVMDQLSLVLERGQWLANPPGTGSSVLISAAEPYDVGDALLVASPQESGDDAWVNDFNSSFTITGASMQIGAAASNTFRAGIRFRNMQIAPGANIKNAKIVGTSFGSDSGAVTSRITGELGDSAVFVSYADFDGRSQTTEFTDWVMPDFTDDVQYETPDFANVVQEIVDDGGWAQGQNMGIFISWLSGSNHRELSQWDFSSAAEKAIMIIELEE